MDGYLQQHLERIFDLTSYSIDAVHAQEGNHPCAYRDDGNLSAADRDLYEGSEETLVATAGQATGGGRFAVKKAYFFDRRVELLCHTRQISPRVIIKTAVEQCWVPSSERKEWGERFYSYSVGVAFGRWDIGRCFSTDTQEADGDIFTALPLRRPGELDAHVEGYSLSFPTDGILTDDPGASSDIHTKLVDVFAFACNDDGARVCRDVVFAIQGNDDALKYLRSQFFDDHLRRYSKSRRKAPIYWQLATPTASYSIWLYYHFSSKDTFFTVGRIARNKLDHERQKLDRLRGEAGAEPTRSQRKEIEEQEKFVAELASMVEEVERIAPLWNPNLNDGVIINFAPLWRLVPQNKSWQKECKKVWDKLVAGDYDWAHLAMHLWPERVVPKCLTDASLAIAHGLEETFWTQDVKDRFQPLEEPDGGWQPVIDNLVAERSSPAVKAALESLLDAPAPTTTKTKRKRKAAAK